MKRQHTLIVHEDAKSPVAEAYRVIRTNLQFCQTDALLHTLIFTGAGPGEGKAATVANTAVALAQTGKKVLLVDCDLRKPVQHHIFKRNKAGVTNHLAEGTLLTELFQESGVPNLTLLASGPVPPNPSELLGSEKMKLLLEQLREEYDYVLIDAPPVIAVTDAAVLASKVDGVVLVLDSCSVRPEMAQQAQKLIQAANGKLLGAILNNVEIDAEHSYYYYYYGKEHSSEGGAQ